MELIPIIYTALIIFGIIAIITIISSYVSYKVKRKVNNSAELEKQKFQTMHEEANKKKVVVKKKKVAPSREHSSSSSSSQSKGKDSTSHKKSDHYHSHEHRESKHRDVKPEKRDEIRKVTGTQRLNVINPFPAPSERTVKPQTNNTPKTKEDKPVKKPINLNSLGDDILNKYAEGNDDDFHSLNATKDED